jgi:protein SCO1/2
MKGRSLLWLGLGGLVGLAVVVLASIVFAKPYQFKGSLINPPLAAENFSIRDQNSRQFTLSDHRGQVVLLYFGYTACPDVCPTTLVDLKKVYDGLGDAAENLQVVFITVDPERDTAALLQDYLARFNEDFIGISGSEEDLQPIWDGYFIFRQIEPHEPGEFYLVDHTSRVYAIDKNGDLRLTFPFGMSAEDMLADVDFLVSE